MKIIELSGRPYRHRCKTYGCLTEGENPGMKIHEEMMFFEIHISGEKWWCGYIFDILRKEWIYREPV